MATKDQHDFFLRLYVEEDERYGQLESRAKLYLSVITVFLATLLFKVEEVRVSTAMLGVPWWLILVEAVLLTASLVFVVFGVFIQTYEGVADPESVIDGFGDQPPTDEEFFDDRIADYVVATTRNSEVNDRAARYLQIAVFLLSIAMILLVFMFALALLKR